MKILSISPSNGWLSRWMNKKDQSFMELEVIVFAICEIGDGVNVLTSFSGPCGDESLVIDIPDILKEDFSNGSEYGDHWPWYFNDYVKVRDLNAKDRPFPIDLK